MTRGCPDYNWGPENSTPCMLKSLKKKNEVMEMGEAENMVKRKSTKQKMEK